jgi:hypothetical protein
VSQTARIPVGDAWVAPKAKKLKKAPRGKPPCKYGPRDADGYCPKKPKTARKKKTATEKKIDREISAATRRAENAIVKGAQEGLSKTATEIAAAGGIKAATKKALAKKIATGVGGATISVGGALAAAAAAGAASFLATTYILKKIKDAKERKAQAAFEAAQQFRKVHVDAAARLGRPLTAPEVKILSGEFKTRLKELGY